VNFSRPVLFEEAIRLNAIKTALPTTLTSRQLAALSADIKRRAQFSARVAEAEYLDQISGTIADMLSGKTSLATGRVQLQQALREFMPALNPDGGVADITSNARLDLILRTQTEMAYGYGQTVQGNDPDVVAAFPCAELYRLEDRKDPRDWEARWRVAAQVAGDTDAQRVLAETGRMIARKDSGIWQALGDGAGGYTDTLGNPYPPFAFNSGMWTRDISRSESLELDLIEPQTVVKPADLPDFNQSLQASYQFRSDAIRAALLQRGDVKFSEGILSANAWITDEEGNHFFVGKDWQQHGRPDIRNLTQHAVSEPAAISIAEGERLMNQGVSERDPLGNIVRFDRATMTHFKRPDQVNRAEFLPLASESVKNPVEIWQQENNDVYIALFRTKTGQIAGGTAFVVQRNGGVESFFRVSKIRKLNAFRKGELIYAK